LHWIVKFVLGRRGSSGNVDVNGLRTVFKVLLAKMNRRYTSNMQKRATAAATVGKAGSAGPARKKKKEEQEEGEEEEGQAKTEAECRTSAEPDESPSQLVGYSHLKFAH
jgi:hypothetical protein